MKIIITAISRNDRTTKDGKKKYVSVGIKCAEYGDRFINGFGNKNNESWQAGDEVDVDIKEVESNGKKYLNFETPDMTARLLSEVNALRVEVTKIREALKPIYLEWLKKNPRPVVQAPAKDIGIEYPENELGEIPFD